VVATGFEIGFANGLRFGMSQGSSTSLVDMNGNVIFSNQSPTAAGGSFLNGALVGINYDEFHSTCAEFEGRVSCAGVSNLMVFPSFNSPGGTDYQVQTSMNGGGGGRVMILVPEPASSILLLTGLGVVLAGARMRPLAARPRGIDIRQLDPTS